MRFRDQVALVSGVGSGIGLATAKRIQAEGGSVVCGLEKIAQVKSLDGLDHVVLDVREPESWRAAIGQVVGNYGGLDILVNNAAIRRPGNAEQIDRPAWDETIAVNLTGAFQCRLVQRCSRGHGPFAGPQYRLEDVVEHRFLAGEDVDLGHHAGDDRQWILGIAEMTAIGAHPNLVEALALLVCRR